MFNKKIFLLAFIIILSFCLRFYLLGKVPAGLYQDETAIGYNAYSILKTGKDEYGKTFPLYFKSFGDYKLPIYIYADVVSVAVFGLNAFAVRFPSAIFGVASVLTLYFLVKQLTKNVNLALLSSFLLAINPWHLHYSRATFEVSISLFLFLAGFYCINRFANSKNKFLLIIGSLLFTLNVYTYNLTRLLSPILLLSLLFYYRKFIFSINRKVLLIIFVINLTLLIPFILTFFGQGGISSANGTLLFSSNVVLSQILEFRGYLLSFPSLINKLFFNNINLLLWTYIKNIFSYFSVNFYFLSGPNHGNHGIGDFGLFYPFELVSIIVGLYFSVIKKHSWSKLLLVWMLLVIVVCSLTRESPHATRSFFLVFPLTVFSAYGFLTIKNILSNLKNLIVKLFISSTIIIVLMYGVIYYLTDYYYIFPSKYAEAWRYQDEKLMEFINVELKNYDDVIFSKKSGFIYSSYLFYSKYDPHFFQNTVEREPDDLEGFSVVNKFNNVEWWKIIHKEDIEKSSPKRLFIFSRNEELKGLSPKKVIFLPKRNIVMTVNGQLFKYPVPIEDVAYYIYETNTQK